MVVVCVTKWHLACLIDNMLRDYENPLKRLTKSTLRKFQENVFALCRYGLTLV